MKIFAYDKNMSIRIYLRKLLQNNVSKMKYLSQKSNSNIFSGYFVYTTEYAFLYPTMNFPITESLLHSKIRSQLIETFSSLVRNILVRT